MTIDTIMVLCALAGAVVLFTHAPRSAVRHDRAARAGLETLFKFGLLSMSVQGDQHLTPARRRPRCVRRGRLVLRSSTPHAGHRRDGGGVRRRPPGPAARPVTADPSRPSGRSQVLECQRGCRRARPARRCDAPLCDEPCAGRRESPLPELRAELDPAQHAELDRKAHRPHSSLTPFLMMLTCALVWIDRSSFYAHGAKLLLALSVGRNMWFRPGQRLGRARGRFLAERRSARCQGCGRSGSSPQRRR